MNKAQFRTTHEMALFFAFAIAFVAVFTDSAAIVMGGFFVGVGLTLLHMVLTISKVYA